MGLAQTAKFYVDEAKTQGVDLGSRYAIVTGASSGIGLETARALAEGGVHVVMACRNVAKARECIAQMQGEGDFKARLSAMHVNLEDFASVKTFASEYLGTGKPLNVLVCNAGTFAYTHRTTAADGYESAFQTCHLAHYLMFRLLETKLVSSAPSRVVMVASITHKLAPEWDWPALADKHKGFGSDVGPTALSLMPSYAQAKLANVHMAQHIAARLGPKGVRAFACHPGGVDSGIYPWFTWPLMRVIMLTPQQGAATSCMLAVGKSMDAFDPCDCAYFENGAMGYFGTKVCATSEFASNVENRERLMRESERIVAAFLP